MALRYSRLGGNSQEEQKSWNNIVLSSTTVAQRKQLKSGMDDFTTFTWRGVDAFDVFGAFIINNKGTLKFYSGPSFTNEYTKPQFESAAGQLTGVTFQVQKIDFTIGVYWINENDYRKLIDWLDPYEINTLTFGFEKDYYYLVKLASRGDPMRHIVGIETDTDGKKVYQYYTEMKLTFEVQGEPCAYRNIEYEWERSIVDSNENSIKYIYQLTSCDDNNFNSDLAMPFKYKMHLELDSNMPQDTEVTITANALYKGNVDAELFTLDLYNLSFSSDINTNFIDLVYDSATGLLYWDHGDSQLFLLSRLSTATTGSRIVKALTSSNYKLLGKFNEWDFDLKQWALEVTVTNATIEEPMPEGHGSYIEMRARTNLI